MCEINLLKHRKSFFYIKNTLELDNTSYFVSDDYDVNLILNHDTELILHSLSLKKIIFKVSKNNNFENILLKKVEFYVNSNKEEQKFYEDSIVIYEEILKNFDEASLNYKEKIRSNSPIHKILLLNEIFSFRFKDEIKLYDCNKIMQKIDLENKILEIKKIHKNYISKYKNMDISWEYYCEYKGKSFYDKDYYLNIIENYKKFIEYSKNRIIQVDTGKYLKELKKDLLKYQIVLGIDDVDTYISLYSRKQKIEKLKL